MPWLTGCSTRAKRIDQNQTLFQSKSVAERQKITHGSVVPGMSRDSVYLVWGNPDQVYKGFEDGLSYEVWHYGKISPKPKINIGFGAGGIAGPGLGLDKSVDKIVRFQGGKVSSFQTRN